MKANKRKTKEQKKNEVLYLVFLFFLSLGFFMAVLACPFYACKIINGIYMLIFLLAGWLLFTLSKCMLNRIYLKEMQRQRKEQDKKF